MISSVGTGVDGSLEAVSSTEASRGRLRLLPGDAMPDVVVVVVVVEDDDA